MDYPKVTVITPSTGDRHGMLMRCIELFKAQDYPNKELTISDSGMRDCLMDVDNKIWHWETKAKTLGDKRNELCHLAQGDIILHMDNDDYYVSDWITKSVQALGDNELTGLRSAWFYRPHKTLWKYQNANPAYILGATMCYRKSLWAKRPFPSVNKGEDTLFVERANIGKAHDYINGFMAMRHGGNTSGYEAEKYMRQYQPDYAKYVLGDWYEKF